MSDLDTQRIFEILEQVRPLAIEYYKLTKKPLGITGELAEYWAAKELGLQLAPARTAGFDAVRLTSNGKDRIQIKGRAYSKDATPAQKISRIKLDAECDYVLLVLLDNATLEPREMWEAPFSAVKQRLSADPISRSRARGALGVPEFKNKCMAQKVWPRAEAVK